MRLHAAGTTGGVRTEPSDATLDITSSPRDHLRGDIERHDIGSVSAADEEERAQATEHGRSIDELFNVRLMSCSARLEDDVLAARNLFLEPKNLLWKHKTSSEFGGGPPEAQLKSPRFISGIH